MTTMDDTSEPLITAARPAPEATHVRITRHQRLGQITTVLSRHGLGFLIGHFGLDDLVPFHKGMLGHVARDEPYTRAEHLRLALEQLGTAAIKVGQILSTRADIMPAPYIDELARLRDRVPPVPAASIRAEVERELGQPITELFAAFEDEPLASASIGQVHAARLPTGEDVVVKVQKPGVMEQVDVDLRLLLDLARMAQERSVIARQYDLVTIAEELAWTLRGELDYEREGRNADTFRRQFAGNPDVVIPVIHWSHTTNRVLTMQRLTGHTIDDVESLKRLDIDLHDLAVRSANLVLAEIFEHGFYHADPHPGNFFVLADGAIGALDFGMVGRISGAMTRDLVDLMTAVVDEDADRAVDAFEALGISGIGANRRALTRDIGHLFDRYLGLSLAQIDLNETTAEIFVIARRHQLRMPAELVLLLKTLTMNEGVGRRLDPDFHLTEVVAPFIHGLMLRRMNPTTWGQGIRSSATDIVAMGLDLPAMVRRLIRRVDRGELAVIVRPREMEEPLRRLDAMVNRLALSILLASFVVGTGLVMVFYHPNSNDSWLVWFFVVGLVAVAALGAWLILAIRRSGRSKPPM